jgi:glycosyltransferase involved in cell wall biosynthesis
MSKDLVSVVIPAYNAEEYVANAIKSVLSQSYRPIEIVLVDDGSKDSTIQVARQIIDQTQDNVDMKIIGLGRNTGTANALNAGFSQARGRFISWLSADDEFIDVNKTTIQAECMRRTGACWSYYENFYSGSNRKSAQLVRVSKTIFHKILESICANKPEPSLIRTLFWNPVNGSSVMIHRRCIAQYGSFDPVLGKFDPDGDLWMRYYVLGLKFIRIPGAPVFYRVHKAQTSKNLQAMQVGKEITRLRVLKALSQTGNLERILSRWSWLVAILAMEGKYIYKYPRTASYLFQEMAHSRDLKNRIIGGILKFAYKRHLKMVSESGEANLEFKRMLDASSSSHEFNLFVRKITKLQQG